MVQWLAPALGTIVVAVFGYLAVIRRTSGRIETTEAGKLWDEAGELRDAYRKEISELQKLVSELRQENRDLRR